MFERPKRRLNFLAFFLVLLGLLIAGQLVNVQIFSHHRLSLEGKVGRETWVEVTAPRGQIWDRNNRLLVSNLIRYDIESFPREIEHPDVIAAALAPHLGMDPGELMDMLSTDDEYVRVVDSVAKEIGETIRNERIPLVVVAPVWRRAYPEDSLGAHLLGFVNRDNEGYYGVEGFYDASLRGKNGWKVYQSDGQGDVIPLEMAEEELAEPGADLVLTIDRAVQALIEQELALALHETGATSGVIIVMDPRSGAILGMAALPVYDPNHFGQVTNNRIFVNPAISNQYEPGSVFKVLTAAVAIEAGLVEPETMFYDEGFVEFAGQIINNATRQSYGNVTMTEVLIHSLNVEMAKISAMLGPERFYEGIRAFGIGHSTGIDLQGEVIGQLREPGDWEWHESDLATNSFGQGLAVTPLQMITAVAAIANDGLLMKPFVVAEKIGRDGQVEAAEPAPVAWAVSPETARKVTEMMAQTVEHGAKLAQVPGYRIAGKTGTAQKPTAFGYDENKTIASFVGFAPVDNPEVIVLVRLDEPTSSEWGTQTAAPAFARLAPRLFLLLEIPPDDVRWDMEQMAGR